MNFANVAFSNISNMHKCNFSTKNVPMKDWVAYFDDCINVFSICIQWCMDGRCVTKDASHYIHHKTARPAQKQPSVDGGWSSWSYWGHCSQDCSIGVRKRQRSCNNPEWVITHHLITPTDTVLKYKLIFTNSLCKPLWGKNLIG